MSADIVHAEEILTILLRCHFPQFSHRLRRRRRRRCCCLDVSATCVPFWFFILSSLFSILTWVSLRNGIGNYRNLRLEFGGMRGLQQQHIAEHREPKTRVQTMTTTTDVVKTQHIVESMTNGMKNAMRNGMEEWTEENERCTAVATMVCGVTTIRNRIYTTSARVWNNANHFKANNERCVRHSTHTTHNKLILPFCPRDIKFCNKCK